MSRFTISTVVSLLWIVSLVESASTEVCGDLLDKYTTCRLNTPNSETNEDDINDDYILDDTACTECIAQNNLFEQYDRQSCDSATNEVCLFFNKCNDKCYPKYKVCSDEVTSYYVCIFGAVYAPESCVVTCEGFGGGAGGEGNGSGETPNNGGGNGGGGSFESPVGDGGNGKDKSGGDNGAEDPKESTSAGAATTTAAALLVSASSLVIVTGLYF